MTPLHFVPNLTVIDDNGDRFPMSPLKAWLASFWYGFDVVGNGQTFEAVTFDCANGTVLGWSA